MIAKIIVCIIAGLGAGIGTGFAGMSAAAVISPMLITFLGFPAYEAVGIAWHPMSWHRQFPPTPMENTKTWILKTVSSC